MKRPGRFVVVEGIDGSGSTTQAERLCRSLTERGHDALFTAEPSIGPLGALIRQVLQHRVVVPGKDGPRAPAWDTLALLFAADRLDHVEATIAPALDAGRVVVSDRYTLSSLTYQSLTSDEPEAILPWLRAINQRALNPDLTLVIDVSAEVAHERRRARGQDAELFEVEALQRKLAAAYARAEHYLPKDHPVVHIDGHRPADAVHADVERATLSLLTA